MRRFAIGVGMALVLVLVLLFNGAPVGEVMLKLALGWFTYPARVLPRVTTNWAGVATGLLCLTVFSIGLHRTLVWITREVQKSRGLATGEGHSWSARWTASLVALIVLMFVAGISAAGIAHQAGWLIAARKSLVEETIESRDDWGSSARHLRIMGEGSGFLAYGSGPLSPDQSGSERADRQSWMTAILPGTSFIIGGELHRDLPWNDPRNSAYFKGIVPIYLNPQVEVIRSDEGYALAHYAGNVHVLGRYRRPVAAGPDGSSTTILAGEIAEGFKPWGDPANLRDPGLGLNQVPGGFGGPSGDGANLLFLDGSVRFFRNTTARDVLRRMSMPGSSEP